MSEEIIFVAREHSMTAVVHCESLGTVLLGGGEDAS